jgi:cytochrome c-type biogenesis protein CcmH/NrfF
MQYTGYVRTRGGVVGGAWLFAIAAILLVPLVSAAPVEAQRMVDRPNAIEAERAISQLRSPYCPGLMLEICPSADAAALRDSIYHRAAQGETSEQLVSWMLTQYGEEWRGVPQRSGAGVWAWVIPPLGVLAGLGVLVTWLKRSREEDGVEAAIAGISDEDREKLALALREWEESGEEEDL